ncbi:MAG TPA: FAD-dependent oxidoreductase, partial [Ktedonobacteraceae bacterium]
MSSGEIKRREFLTFCGAGALSSLLASCQLGPINIGGGGSPLPYPARPSSTPTDGDWSSLAKSLQGMLVRPDSPQYMTAQQLFDPRYDNVQPQAIAYCSSPEDVQNCLALVRRFNLPFAPRCGGHSYVGYSTSKGLIIDVTKMNTVNVNTGNTTATIGAGTRLIDVYAALTQQGLILPAGSCPSVGIAGLTLGGGAGVLDRKFGLTCDNMLSAQVVTADGRILTCDASHNSDLFWALRGGGGGNFGV